MLARLREAKRAADASKAAGLCPVCDHTPHRDTACQVFGCHCRWHKSFNSDLERLAEAREQFGNTLVDALQPLVDALPARVKRWLDR